jgi:putative chitinase
MDFIGLSQLVAISSVYGFGAPAPWVPDSLNESLGAAVVNTPLRLAHYLAQTCWESAGWTAFEEPDWSAVKHAYGTMWKGRGVIQVTWNYNYQALASWAGKPELYSRPDLVATPDYACLSGAWYWSTHQCNPAADNDDSDAVSRIINGRTCTTLAQRAMLTSKAKEVIGV